jgi:hypothetical protein
MLEIFKAVIESNMYYFDRENERGGGTEIDYETVLDSSSTVFLTIS